MDGITDSMDVNLSELQDLVTDREGLACCDSWGRKESDTTERLKWNWKHSIVFDKMLMVLIVKITLITVIFYKKHPIVWVNK